MGPGPPPQKNKNVKNGSQRALNTAGQGSSYAGSTAMSSEPPSSPTAVTEGSRISGEGWNRKRYQREDEALWGHDVPGPGQRIMDAIAKAGSQAGRLLEGRLYKNDPGKEEEEAPAQTYYARNPPVNDLHPPVVSTAPASRDETRWMLQPPPPAKVMEGKERVNRSRAGSNGSSRKGQDEIPLSRQVTERLVDAKLQRGETISLYEAKAVQSRPESWAKAPSTPSPTQRKARRPKERNRSSSIDSSDSSSVPRKTKRKPLPLSISPSVRSSEDSIVHIPIPAAVHLSNTPEMREQPVRPVLSTILSSSNMVPLANGEQGVRMSPTRSNTATEMAMASKEESSGTRKLSPNANAMPASIPSVETKFPGAATYRFPGPKSTGSLDSNSQVPCAQVA